MDVESLWEGDGVGAIEGVERKGAKGTAEEGADVDGDIDWLDAVDIEEQIGHDVGVWILERVGMRNRGLLEEMAGYARR